MRYKVVDVRPDSAHIRHTLADSGANLAKFGPDIDPNSASSGRLAEFEKKLDKAWPKSALICSTSANFGRFWPSAEVLPKSAPTLTNTRNRYSTSARSNLVKFGPDSVNPCQSWPMLVDIGPSTADVGSHSSIPEDISQHAVKPGRIGRNGPKRGRCSGEAGPNSTGVGPTSANLARIRTNSGGVGRFGPQPQNS